MIELVNNAYLTQEQRKNAIFRAIHSQNFFALADVRENGIARYGNKAQVDKDFYLTQIAGDWLKSQLSVKDIGLSVYLANRGQSAWRYIRSEVLPIPQVAYNVHQGSTTKSTNVQFEINPFFVPKGENLTTEFKRLDGGQEFVDDATVMLGGYYTLPKAYMNGFTTKSVNQTLANDISYDIWNSGAIVVPANKERLENYVFNNDRFTRLILGFACIPNADNPETNIQNMELLISDPYRGIKLSNVPIPWRFLAPNSANQAIGSQDVHWYYLPIEHFWQPMAPLKFELSFAGGAPSQEQTYTIYMLTRTV